MGKNNQPHGFEADPDGRCMWCRRAEAADIHSDEAHARVVALTPRPLGSATNWADMTGPQRFVCAVVLGAVGLVVVCACLAVCLHLIEWGIS